MQVLTVSVGSDGETTATVYSAQNPGGMLLVFANGAGASQRHPFMTACAEGLAARGVKVVTFDFLYTHQKRKVPDRTPVLERCFAAVIAQVALGRSRLFIGGKSMGGRIATHLAAQGDKDLAGVVALGYPLHPPASPINRGSRICRPSACRS